MAEIIIISRRKKKGKKGDACSRVLKKRAAIHLGNHATFDVLFLIFSSYNVLFNFSLTQFFVKTSFCPRRPRRPRRSRRRRRRHRCRRLRDTANESSI